MSIDYNAIAEGAAAALAEAGATLLLSVPNPSSYDPASGTASITSTSYAITGAILPAGQINGSGFSFGSDVAVRAQALVLLAATGQAPAPKPGCSINVSSGPMLGTWSVIGADVLAPAGVAVLYGLAVVR